MGSEIAKTVGCCVGMGAWMLLAVFGTFLLGDAAIVGWGAVASVVLAWAVCQINQKSTHAEPSN